MTDAGIIEGATAIEHELQSNNEKAQLKAKFEN